MFIKPTPNCPNLYEIDEDDLYLAAMLYPVTDDVPCPWNADFRIEGHFIRIDGDLGEGGPIDGTCNIRVPIKSFSKYFKLEVPDEHADAALAAGWQRA